MAIQSIIRMGHPTLAQKAMPLEPTSAEAQSIVQDLVDTLEANGGGLGLAAPQINISKRVLIYNIPSDRNDEDLEVAMTALINPQILRFEGETIEDWEACFSLPGLVGRVSRANQIRYRYQTLDGETIEATASGFHARVLQHEIDHLDGVLYVSRMSDITQLAYYDELIKD